MARRLRNDCPGAEFHVMNRGIARRTIFDTPDDYRFFLSCLARAVRRGEIAVLAYALMRTHFHLYLRSHGGLSTAMRRIQLRHVRRFNRLHRRDGPLLRNRFLSKRVDSHAYGRNVVYYVHDNPVLARLCEDPTEYPWSSAWMGAQSRVPLWFSPEAIDRYGIAKYPRGKVASERILRARAELMEARLHARAVENDVPLDAATPEEVRQWMARKALLADGVRSSLPQVGASTIRAVLDHALGPALGGLTPVPGAGTYATRELLLAGLLRDVSCCAHTEIASALGQSVSRSKRLFRLHRLCMLHLPEYADQAAQVVSTSLDILEGR